MSRAVESTAPMMGTRILRVVIEERWHLFRSVVLQALLGVSATAAKRDFVSKALGKKTSIHVYGPSHWWIERPGQQDQVGDGLIQLAAALFGVSSGVAAVRILEAASAETLDAATALGIQNVIDDWIARGAPSRERRS